MRTPHSTHRVSIFIAICLTTCLTGSIGAATYLSDRRPEFGRKFDTIWRETRDQFFDPNMNGCDWQAVGNKYRPSAEGASSHPEFQEIVNRMLGELKASHLGYYTDQDLEYYLLSSIFSRDG